MGARTGRGTGTPWSRNHERGQAGEDLAAAYLVERGMEVVERNWRCRAGEVDLVLIDGADLVFCEVKTRRTAAFGTPLEAVTDAKAARLRRLAYAWLEDHDWWGERIRIDVVGILLQPNPPPARGQQWVPEIQHWRGVA